MLVGGVVVEDERGPSCRPHLGLDRVQGVTVPGDRFTSATDGPCDRDGNSGAHAPDSHGYRNRGIPISQRATPAGRIIMLTRRNFGTALVAGAALATSAQQARPQPASKRTIVDAQVHFWKANSPDWAWDPGARPQLPEPFSRFDRRSASRLATHLCELRCRWRARAADNRPVAWARSGSHHRAIRTSGQ